MNFERVCGISLMEISGQRVPERSSRTGKSVLSWPYCWSRQCGTDSLHGYSVTCRARSARDSARTEEVKEMSRKGSVEIAVSEKRQLVVNSPQTRLHAI